MLKRLAMNIMLMSGFRRMVVAMAAGAFGVLALPPFGFFAAMFVSFTILVWLMDGASGRPGSNVVFRMVPAFRIGWSFGFGYLVAGLFWLGNALLVEAGDYGWALPLAVLGLPAVLALFYGLAGAVARLFWSEGFGRIAALAMAFGLAEWLRSFVLTGFPWNAVGQGIMPVPLMMQSIGLLGGATMNIVAVLVFAAPALIATRRGMVTGLGLSALLLVGHVGYGAWVLNTRVVPADSKAALIRLVQPNIDQSRKIGDADRAAIFEEHLALSAQPSATGAKPTFIIWPETSIPFILTQNRDALSRIADVLDDNQILFAGAVRAEDPGSGLPVRYYNSIYMIDGQGQIIGAYDKVHLVPFGEYMPFQSMFDWLGLKAVAAMPGGFSAANTHDMLVTPDGTGFFPLICYEVLFADSFGPPPAGTKAILNVTNDGWFGNTPGPAQHFFQARLRAVESGLPLIRASNSGISAVISPFGLVKDGLAFGQTGFADLFLPETATLPVEPSWHAKMFWIGTILTFLIAFFSRMGFRFNGN